MRTPLPSNIQNTGLPPSEVRDLNDLINKLLREKYHWNRRIRELGGQDYAKIERSNERAALAAEGPDAAALQGGGGYKYFGRAKELPGVS